MPTEHIYKKAVITGASDGIGEAIAHELSDQTHLLLIGRNLDKLKDMRHQLNRLGRMVEICSADLTTREGLNKSIKAIDAFVPDLFVNNAGFGIMGPFSQADLETEKEMVALNVLAVMELAYATIPHLKERANQFGRASMVITSSVAGFNPAPYFATYGATKSFELFWGQSLDVELRGEGVDVLTLCPGGTKTSFFKRARPHQGKSSDLSQTAQEVAKEAIDALNQKKRLHVCGHRNRLWVLGGRFLPRQMVASIVEKVFKKLASE